MRRGCLAALCAGIVSLAACSDATPAADTPSPDPGAA
ncbi:hypothetical protein DFR46_2026 [Parasphingopyxis lamellibrachiae]|uniref:Uncharacterized protein n=1 Tax=Parasphingopyxis lamellibrachiae TaxID=680125 RepID=A0A3D9FHF0_9SPHN|nr:hypothetical protein DFR46_2026 [Parasphingopyxis lamellibrachiae]